MMASLPANDPARKLSVTSRASVRALINDATRRNLFTGHKETKTRILVPVPQADLVFGGSYPIDEPLSARNVSQKEGRMESVTHKNNGGSYPIDEPLSARNISQKDGRLESVTRKNNAERTPIKERRTTGQITITRPKTFQIDGICCIPPNLCEDHAAAALVSAHQEEVLAEGSANTMLPLHDDKFVKQYLAAYYGAKQIEGDEEDYYYQEEEDGEAGGEMYDEDDYEDYQPSDVDYEADLGNYPSSAEQQSHGGENTTSITAENEQKSEECRRRKAVTYQEMPSNHDTNGTASQPSPPEAKLNYAKDSKDPPPTKCLDDLIKDYKEKSAIASNVSLTIPPPDLGQLQEFLRPPAHLQQV